jgi:hypothetical protein
MEGRQALYSFPHAKMLATYLLDEINECNWSLRDRFKHWKVGFNA